MRSTLLFVYMAVIASGCRGCVERPSSSATGPRAAGDRLELAGAAGCRFDAVVVAGWPEDRRCEALSRPDAAATSLGVSGGLGGFCRLDVSRWSGFPNLRFEDIDEALKDDLPEGASLSPDCVVVQPFGVETGTVSSAARRLAGFPIGPAVLPQRPVRVAVLDSSPTGGAEVFDDNENGHGARVGRILEALACAAGPCAFEVVSEQALPRLDPRVSDGYPRGSLSELAVAVDRAVSAAPEPSRLVLNLSLGWDPQSGGKFSDPVRSRAAALKLMLRALRVAACRGALVVAAMGPRPASPLAEPAAATFPAAWSTSTRPDALRCRDWLNPELVAPVDDARPLLLAVDAVGPYQDPEARDARPLATARFDATPTLHAYGVFAEGDGAGLIGSSAASAIVSGSVAWILRYAEGESPDTTQVVRGLVRSGSRMGASVDVPLAASPNSSRAKLVTPCRAIEEHCTESSCPRCPEPTELPQLALREGKREVLASTKGRVCPNDGRVTVFAPASVPLEDLCASKGSDVLRHPWSRPSGTRPFCQRCAFRAERGARRVQVDLRLAPNAPSSLQLVFSTGRQLAIHPLSGEARERLLDIELPGPVPRDLEARVVFSAEVSSVEPLVRVW